MSLLSMSCPSVTLDRIIYTIHENLDYNLSDQEFVTVNLRWLLTAITILN